MSLQKGSIKTWLTGAGLSLGTATITMTVFNTAIEKFQDQVDLLSFKLLALLHLSGFDVFFSTILAAIATYIGLKASNLSLKKGAR